MIKTWLMSNTLPLSWPSADYISGTRSSHFSTQCIHSEEKNDALSPGYEYYGHD